jgi:DNA invertase Pin-like site-specific DNA recombinase
VRYHNAPRRIDGDDTGRLGNVRAPFDPQPDGRVRAKANGQRFGRKPVLTPYQRAEVLRRKEAGETLTEIAKSTNVSHMTIARATSNGAADEQGGE